MYDDDDNDGDDYDDDTNKNKSPKSPTTSFLGVNSKWPQNLRMIQNFVDSIIIKIIVEPGIFEN